MKTRKEIKKESEYMTGTHKIELGKLVEAVKNSSDVENLIQKAFIDGMNMQKDLLQNQSIKKDDSEEKKETNK